MDREQGLTRIRAAIAESLGLSPGEVRPDSRLIADLGANSLDIIDVVFTLERSFEVKLRDSELDGLLRGELFGPEAVADGYLRPAAVEELAALVPGLAAAPDRARVTPAQVIGLVTVETLWRIVERRLRRPEGRDLLRGARTGG